MHGGRSLASGSSGIIKKSNSFTAGVHVAKELSRIDDLPRAEITEPISLENLIYQRHQLLEDCSTTTRTVHSDPEETQTKTKSRSRFTTALRKLSRSTRKKEKPEKPEKPPIRSPSSTATESSEQIISSGAEDLPEANLTAQAEKESKKKKKSIFGLRKKSKVVPKHEDTYINFEEEENNKNVKYLEPIFQDNENEVVVTTERLTPTNSRSKVQITIKSKKIETVASQQQITKNPPASLSVSPSPTNQTVDDSTLTQSSNEPVDKKNIIETDVLTQTEQKSTTTIAQSESKQREDEKEQITFTQSSKDTPPKEKAPTKPSRLPTTTSATASNTRTNTSTGAIRKTATTAKAAIKLVAGAKPKQKASSSSKTSKLSRATDTSTAAASVSATQKEIDLMINPQRGHRLPRPTSITANQFLATTTSTDETQSTDQTKALSANSSNQEQQNQPKSPDCLTTLDILPQTSIEIQSSLTNASLETPPPPTPATATADNITTSRQQQQENIQTSRIDNSNSVQLQSFPQTDDHISIAESVKPGNLHSLDSLETIKEPVIVNFAVGSPVRAPLQQSRYEFSTQEPSVLLPAQQPFDLHNPSTSEASRRPIHYIPQASLYDEINSLELKRSRLRYQSGVSDLSLDTDENQETFEASRPMPAFGDLTMDQDSEPTVMTTSNSEKHEHLYKILVIGELGTGKTSFIKRYVHQFFSQNYRATIGVDFALKVLQWDTSTIVRLQLWDIAGQERFGNMTRVYYKEAVGAFIVFDITRSGTFDCVSKWKEDLDSKVQLPDGSPIPCILLANKCDQDKQFVATQAERMDDYVKQNGFTGWFETSAKDNINVDEAARALVNKILLNDKLISASDLADSEKFNLNNAGADADDKSKCSC